MIFLTNPTVMKKMLCGLTTLLLMFSANLSAQQVKTYKVGLFVPLYLDSAYSETGTYRFGKGFPKQSLPGLEFYQGAEFAMEAFNENGKANVELQVFDIRSRTGSIGLVSKLPIMDSLNLVIGQVSGNEYLQLAQIARERDIPFVSATYPNDGGVKGNPNVLILNAKLNSHIQTIYNHILRNKGTENIIWVRRSDISDNRIEDIFKEFNKSPEGNVLQYQTVTLPAEFTEQHLNKYLDSTQENVIIAGSLDEGFAKKLAANCLKIGRSYPVTIVGMPTWEGIAELKKKDYRPLRIEYSSTFYRSAMASWNARIEDAYRKKSFSKPSDMTFKGYQATYHFVSLLLRYDTAVLKNLNDSATRSMTDFDFRPVFWSRSNSVPDYHENKRIYILRQEKGQISLLN